MNEMKGIDKGSYVWLKDIPQQYELDTCSKVMA